MVLAPGLGDVPIYMLFVSVLTTSLWRNLTCFQDFVAFVLLCFALVLFIYHNDTHWCCVFVYWVVNIISWLFQNFSTTKSCPNCRPVSDSQVPLVGFESIKKKKKLFFQKNKTKNKNFGKLDMVEKQKVGSFFLQEPTRITDSYSILSLSLS